MMAKAAIGEKSIKVYDSIVVGCGAAGIAALSRMHGTGMAILGLEAATYVGGRVNTTTFDGGVVELGAEWIHGERDNVVFEMVNGYNIVEPTAFQFEYYDSNGTFINEELTTKLLNICLEITADVGKHVGPNLQSMEDHFNKEFPLALKKAGLELSENMKKMFVEWYHKHENVIDGCDDWANISTKGLAQYVACEGHSTISWSHHGYRKVFDIMMNGFPNEGRRLTIPIMTSTTVKNIIWKPESDKEKNVIEIICESGLTFYCKSVIITVSLGVLKAKHLDMFHPELPKEKVDCINGIAFGTVDKIFLSYEHNWWGKETFFGLLWCEDAKESLSPEDKWMANFFCVSCPNSNNKVLCLWLSGPAARHMENLSDEVVQQKANLCLQKFLGSRFVIPLPTGMLRSQWYNNPFTQGSYSHHGMECDEMKASTQGLAEPLLDNKGFPLVCFAGEATSEKYFSTVHGAIESGYREAERLIQTWKLGSKLKIFAKY